MRPIIQDRLRVRAGAKPRSIGQMGPLERVEPPCQTCSASPAPAHGYYRLRYDHVDAGGKVSIRHAGRMHDLGIGTAHRGKEIPALPTPPASSSCGPAKSCPPTTSTPARAYWRNKQRSPGRWPGLPVT